MDKKEDTLSKEARFPKLLLLLMQFQNYLFKVFTDEGTVNLYGQGERKRRNVTKEILEGAICVAAAG